MKHFFLLFITLNLTCAYAQDSPPLDPIRELIVTPLHSPKDNNDPIARRNDVERNIGLQTPVKNQMRRGTCSIFSAVGMVEHLYKVKTGKEVDLAEEWVEYLNSLIHPGSGGWFGRNLQQMKTYGAPLEKDYTYIGDEWKTTGSSFLARERCAHLSDQTQYRRLTRCLKGHRDPKLMKQTDSVLLVEGTRFYDPKFLKARKLAKSMKEFLGDALNYQVGFRSVQQVKKKLNEGVAVGLSMPVHAGAWNHGGGRKHGIPRDSGHWAKGIVAYPENGVKDKSIGGHSIIVVGYDDDREFEKTVLLKNGRRKTFTYRGVYYFKNSWGTSSFGVDFSVEGKNYPGYGMLAQKYVHHYGSFK